MEKCLKCGKEKSKCTCKDAELTPQKIMEAVSALHETVKKLKDNPDSAELKESLEKINDDLDKAELKNQEFVKEWTEQKKVAQESKEQIEALEKEVARKSTTSGVDWKKSEEYVSLQKYYQFGEKGMSAEDVTTLKGIKTLRSDIDPQGGYLTGVEFDDQILKNITEISNMRSVCRVKVIADKSLSVPKRTGIPTVTHEGETQAGTPSNSEYATESLTPHRLTCIILYTLDMLQTSRFDLESEINGDAGEAFAKQMGEDNIIGTGTGDKMSEGIIVNASVVANALESSTASELNYLDLIEVTGELKMGYDPMYGFNRRTLATIRAMVDAADRPVWQIKLSDNAPNLINGEPYIIFNDMPNIAAGTLPVVYADFLRGYMITDRAGMVIIRDENTLADQAMVRMIFHRWTYGQVMLEEAIKAIEIKSP